MTYNKIGTILCGHLPINKEINIKLIDPSNDKIISSNTTICNESTVSPGLYYFDTNKINDEEFLEELNNKDKDIIYIMSDDSNNQYGGKINISSNYNNIVEQIQVIKNILEEVPDSVLNADITDDINYKQLLINIKQNTDLILV